MKIQRVRLLMVSLALVAVLFVAVLGRSKRPAAFPLHCHLIAERTLPLVDGLFTADFELRNDSNEPIAIQYLETMADNLSLDIRDPDGKTVPNNIPHYGDLYATIRLSSDMNKRTFVLKPGETYSIHLLLFGQVDLGTYQIVPGKYIFETVYEWGGKAFRSNPVTVEVQANDVQAK